MNAKSKMLHKWLKAQGVVICNDPEAAELFLTYTIPVASTFPEIVDKLSAVYTYRMNEQGTADLRSNDGISWHYESELGMLYGIGLSVEALNSGRDYAAFVFLHELCHIATSTDHSISFHDTLGKMIDRYAKEEGHILVNDMFDVPYNED